MIGFFDSGVGGLTISEAVRSQLPSYQTLYLGDTARAPYGTKSHDELVELTWRGVSWLFDRGCDLVIVACNTASASALREIQQTRLSARTGKKILGIIRPTVEALARDHYQNIVVLATPAAITSEAYPREFQKENTEINVYSHACPTWGPMIEAGLAQSDVMKEDVDREVRSLENETATYDAVLLACTHYPYVQQHVEQALSHRVPVFTQGTIVAAALADYLKRHPEIDNQLPRADRHDYFVTGDAKLASDIAERYFGFPISFSHTDLS